MATVDLIVIVSAMLMAAFFSGIETGVISTNRIRLRHRLQKGSRNARVLQNFLDHPDRLLATVLVGTNVCVVVCSIFAARLATRWWPHWGEAIAGVSMTLLLVAFSEYVPKAWFQSRPLERSLPFARLLQASFHVLRPVSAVVNGATSWLLPKAPASGRVRRPFVSREDLKVLIRELDSQGALAPSQRAMIHRVFELSGRTAGQIMVPRTRFAVVPADARVGDLLDTARRTGFRRFPVYAGAKGRFVGVVNLIDVLSAEDPDPKARVQDFMRAPQFIPDYMPVDDILPRMRRARLAQFLVTDLKGDVVGLVTMADVLEEIVGAVS